MAENENKTTVVSDDGLDKLRSELTHLSENYIKSKKKIKDSDDVRMTVRRAFCPKCGKEIICKYPPMYNPYTMEKIIRHDCKCGEKYNLEHTYPRIVYLNSKGEEIKVVNE